MKLDGWIEFERTILSIHNDEDIVVNRKKIKRIDGFGERFIRFTLSKKKKRMRTCI